jgi:hypothetical protein
MKPLRFTIPILVALLFVSCATLPPARSPDQWMGVLPPVRPDSVYLFVDVSTAGGLLQLVERFARPEAEEVDKALSRVRYIYAQLRFSAAAPIYSLIVLGDLTPTAVAMKLNGSESWQRVSLDPGPETRCSCWSLRTYWRENNYGLEIAAPRRGLVLLTGGGGECVPGSIAVMLERLHDPAAAVLAPEAARRMQAADFFLYFPDPGGLAAASTPNPATSESSTAQKPQLSFRRLPLGHVWLAGMAAGQSYDLEMGFALTEVKNPRAIEALLSLILIAWMRSAQVDDPVGHLKSVTITVENDYARIESLKLRQEEFFRFFEAFVPEGR